MYCSKIRNVRSPEKATSKAAGFDMYIPEYSNDYAKFLSEKNTADKMIISQDENGFKIILRPHSIVRIYSGIVFDIPDGFYLKVGNRGSISSKRGIVYTSDIIDTDYTGELFFALLNTTNDNVSVYFGEKIIQVIKTAIDYDIPKVVPYEYMKKIIVMKKSERGENCLGSSDN